jgi:hypothetical protein
MRIYYFLFILLLGLVSCDKNKQATKKISGEWKLVSYRITIYGGLTEYTSGTGKWIFDSRSPYNQEYPYEFTYDCQFPSIVKKGQQKGKFKLLSNGKTIEFTTEDSIGNTTKTENYQVLTHTNDDLELEFVDEQSWYHRYVLKKVKN